MADKSLKEKAIDIKGKKYILVSDRVVFFNEEYKNGYITSKLITDPLCTTIIIQATVIPDCDKPSRFFTGYSQAIIGDGYINKTSALENAETSAVGRALAMLGIGVIESIASVDEINKAKTYPAKTAYIPVANRFPTRPSETKIVPDNGTEPF